MAKRDYRLSPKEIAAAPLRNPMWEHLVAAIAAGGNRNAQAQRVAAVRAIGNGKVFATAQREIKAA